MKWHQAASGHARTMLSRIKINIIVNWGNFNGMCKYKSFYPVAYPDWCYNNYEENTTLANRGQWLRSNLRSVNWNWKSSLVWFLAHCNFWKRKTILILKWLTLTEYHWSFKIYKLSTAENFTYFCLIWDQWAWSWPRYDEMHLHAKHKFRTWNSS